jgi:hypothetical protein
MNKIGVLSSIQTRVINMYLVTEIYTTDIEPTFTKFRGKKKALEYLHQEGYTVFDEEYEQDNGIKCTRVVMEDDEYNIAFLIHIK